MIPFEPRAARVESWAKLMRAHDPCHLGRDRGHDLGTVRSLAALIAEQSSQRANARVRATLERQRRERIPSPANTHEPVIATIANHRKPQLNR